MVDTVSNNSSGIRENPTGIIDELIESIRDRLVLHLNELQLGKIDDGDSFKRFVRASHSFQRLDIQRREAEFSAKLSDQSLLEHFANGTEVNASKIRPYLVRVEADSAEARLFRLATLLWSVPVSRGFGRRMRYLVMDRSNNKLIGIFGLTDPVFNLTARDEYIGWNVNDRRARLVNVMDAHVVGAVPPYSQLLGGKLVASLMTSKEVCSDFEKKYRKQKGLISGAIKKSKLTVITVTSALGRSSMYNRLRIPGLVDFRRIGFTKGWGHFHVSDQVFSDMRALLSAVGHPYANGHQFGQGPNWRMRVVRAAFDLVGIDQNKLQHGIEREVFIAPIAENWQEYLNGTAKRAYIKRPSVTTIARQALDRWIIPRAERCPDFRSWTRDETWALLHPSDYENEADSLLSLLI